MRISLLDHHGKELDFATVDDVLQAPAEAMYVAGPVRVPVLWLPP
jgi:hypothetical protein